MRIGVEITGALAGGGYRRYAEGLLNALAALPEASGHEFFITGAFWGGFPERAESLRLPRGGNFRWALKRFPQSLLLPADELLGLRLQQSFLRPLKLDLMHGLFSTAPRLDGVPTVVTLHYAGRWDFRGVWDDFYFNRLTERSVRRARRVLAISEFCLEEAAKSWGLPRDRFAVVPHGGPEPRFRPDPGPRAGPPYFLFVGGLTPQKNPMLLAEAFAILARRRPAWRHTLRLAGPPGGESMRLQEFFSREGLSSRVSFLGPVDPGRIHELYQGADAVACPSLQEGFAFPVLEAMACGVPVVGVRAGGLVETIGDAGLLAEPAPEPLAAALARAVEDAALRADLAGKGLRRAAGFTWERAARRTLAVYEEALRP
jgi:glycosyltransferase involved in cell wall biosynthesis